MWIIILHLHAQNFIHTYSKRVSLDVINEALHLYPVPVEATPFSQSRQVSFPDVCMYVCVEEEGVWQT